MMKRLRNKLIDKRGESLAEVMVAILVSAVGMLLMSALIMTATNIVNQGDKQMKTLYNGISLVETQGTPTETGKQIVIEYNGASKSQTYANVNIFFDDASNLISYQQNEEVEK